MSAWIAVPPLSLPVDGGTGSEAETLFLDRAERAGLRDADPQLVAEICCRLDGMPLAIELAAARSSSLGADGLLDGLDDRLRLLRSGPAGRHESLRAVLDWSHALLSDEERTAFRRLGAFVGAFDVEAVVAVAGQEDATTASDLVGRLTDKSLLEHVPDPGGSRWRMLETVHAYAREELEASGEAEPVRLRHRGWAAARAVELEQQLDHGKAWMGAFDGVSDDLRTALHVPDDGKGERYRLAFSLAHLSYARGFLVEARHHFESAVRSAPDDADRGRRAPGVSRCRLRGDARGAGLPHAD